MPNIITGNVQASYAHVFIPSAIRGSDDPKYSCCLLLDKSDKTEYAKWVKAVKEAIAEGVVKRKFTGAMTKDPKFKLPIRDGDFELSTEAKKGAEWEGKWFINANMNPFDKDGNPQKPEILKASHGEVVDIVDSKEFYSGCICKADISIYPYNSGGSKGIAIGLNSLFKISDGTRLDGRSSGKSAFKAEAEEVGHTDPVSSIGLDPDMPDEVESEDDNPFT